VSSSVLAELVPGPVQGQSGCQGGRLAIRGELGVMEASRPDEGAARSRSACSTGIGVDHGAGNQEDSRSI